MNELMDDRKRGRDSPSQFEESPDHIRHDLILLLEGRRVVGLDLRPRSQPIRRSCSQGQREINGRRLGRSKGGISLAFPSHIFPNTRETGAYILPSQLFLDNRIRHVPPSNTIHELRRLRRVVTNEFGSCRSGLVEPEQLVHLPVRPEVVRDAGDQRKRRRPGTGLSIRNNFFHEPLVFVGFPVVQWWVLHDLSAGQPN